jgi:acetate---CoA ligase (ADP-forming)
MKPVAGLKGQLLRASAEEIGGLLAPRSIAVIGASANPTRFGGKIVPSLQRHGYKGDIYPINPGRAEVSGLRCYPSLVEVPGEIDCVVFGVAPSQIMPVLEQCAAKSVKLVVVASAGFAESGMPEGEALQLEAAAFARRHGIRLLGPNCIGFGNFVERTFVSAAAALEWSDIPTGRIGVVTQSGGLGLATIIYSALDEGISFSHIVSTGNEADLDTIDVARFFVADPATDVVAMTIEAVKDADAFLELARSAGEAGKPVVVLKSGRSDLGKTMAASHTGALAGSAAVFEMVCRKYGVICAEDVDDFYQIAAMFAKLRTSGKLARHRAPGDRCAALSLSGGHVGLFADHGSLAGLTFPKLAPATLAAITDTLGFEGNFQNPLDVTAKVIGDDGFWGRCVRALMNDPAVEVVVPIITVAHSYETAIRDFMAIAREQQKTIVVLWAGGSFEPGERDLIARCEVPVFRTSARAAAGLAALDAWCRVWNDPARRPRAPAVAKPPAKERRRLEAACAGGRRALTERESKEILSAAGVPVTREIAASGREEAVAAAREIGFPVVFKGEHPTILHKSDAGLVLLGVADEAAAAAAYDTICERMAGAATGPEPGRVLVQEMCRPRRELILGMKTDPEFGPVVVVGLGGIFTEALKDVAMRLPPFDHEEARRMLDELRSATVLKGARGQPPVDLDKLASIIADFSAFVADNCDLLAEVDINPLVETDTGALVALDGLIVLADQDSSKKGASRGC